jgi:hypothetical protein
MFIMLRKDAAVHNIFVKKLFVVKKVGVDRLVKMAIVTVTLIINSLCAM